MGCEKDFHHVEKLSAGVAGGHACQLQYCRSGLKGRADESCVSLPCSFRRSKVGAIAGQLLFNT